MTKLISLKEQKKFIKSRGWNTWYNPKYWVNPKTVSSPKEQDYTYYGMDLNSAYCFEKLNLPKFSLTIMPRLAMNLQGLENMKRIKKLLKTLEKN